MCTKNKIYQCSEKNGVYRWVDENGIIQFSDKPSMDLESENLTKKYSNRFQFFTVEVQNKGRSLPADMPTRLSVDTQQIFTSEFAILKDVKLRLT